MGNRGGMLVRKLVKPTKVVCSWAPHQRGLSQVLPLQAEADVGTLPTSRPNFSRCSWLMTLRKYWISSRLQTNTT
jgi:hypothetical protein